MSGKAPTKKSITQAMTWLQSIAADKDSLDGINANICVSIIQRLRHQLDVKGAIICNLRKTIDQAVSDKKFRNLNSDPTKIIGYVKYEYGGYYSYATYSLEDHVFYGKIEDIDDLVTWSCDKEDDISKEFKDAIIGYLDICKENGKDPCIPRRKRTLMDYLV